MSAVVALNDRRPAVMYTVRIRHAWDGELSVYVEDVEDDERSRASIAWALREAAAMMEDGKTEILKEPS